MYTLESKCATFEFDINLHDTVREGGRILQTGRQLRLDPQCLHTQHLIRLFNVLHSIEQQL